MESKLIEALQSLEFKQNQYDYSLFTKITDKGITIALVYVDDLLITGIV